MDKFTSDFRELGPIHFPGFKGVRVQLMPIRIGEIETLPAELVLAGWMRAVLKISSFFPELKGKTGYLTIDQREVRAGETHRRPGLHVDGYGTWGRGGGWGRSGMLMASSIPACSTWKQDFIGAPLTGKDCGDPNEGNCDHLKGQCRDDARIVLKPNVAYWCDALCVHESLPVAEDCKRTFIRLSFPSDSAWPVNCTRNPLVDPIGPIGEPRRTVGRFAYSTGAAPALEKP